MTETEDGFAAYTRTPVVGEYAQVRIQDFELRVEGANTNRRNTSNTPEYGYSCSKNDKS